MSTDIENYPSLKPEEFAEACHHLDSQYCRATLGPLRKAWKLRVCSALDTTFSFGSGYATYIQIVRPLTPQADLDLDLSKFSISDPSGGYGFTAADEDMMDEEESDEVRVLPNIYLISHISL